MLGLKLDNYMIFNGIHLVPAIARSLLFFSRHLKLMSHEILFHPGLDPGSRLRKSLKIHWIPGQARNDTVLNTELIISMTYENSSLSS